MDLQEQLRKLFPEHVENSPEPEESEELNDRLWIPEDTIECHFEKRKGKPHTIIKGYTGEKEDFRQLAKELKKMLNVGGTAKNDEILIQGDYRAEIMQYLKGLGMKVKRVGG